MTERVVSGEMSAVCQLQVQLGHYVAVQGGDQELSRVLMRRVGKAKRSADQTANAIPPQYSRVSEDLT